MASVKDALASMAKNIETATGKPVKTWVALVHGGGFSKHGQMVTWLKDTHSMGHGYANYIAKEALKTGDGGDDDLVDTQFSGNKSSLKPLYDQMIKLITSMGSDVDVAPKKNNVSLRRNKQFALLQASTATRLDLGLILKGVKPGGRLEASGSFNAMFTHRVKLSSSKDIDAELKSWIKQAYAQA